MKQTLLELVDVILRRIDEQPHNLPSESGIRAWLARLGYAKRDIDAAMKLVRPRFQGVPYVLEHGPGKLRQLSDFEAIKMSPEARNALVRLELYELLDPMEREAILERLDQFEGEVGLAELDYLVSWVLSGRRDYEYQQTVYNVLEGKGETLH
jgi:uncharacterized protein Smg (DUF494 family)